MRKRKSEGKKETNPSSNSIESFNLLDNFNINSKLILKQIQINENPSLFLLISPDNKNSNVVSFFLPGFHGIRFRLKEKFSRGFTNTTTVWCSIREAHNVQGEFPTKDRRRLQFS